MSRLYAGKGNFVMHTRKDNFLRARADAKTPAVWLQWLVFWRAKIHARVVRAGRDMLMRMWQQHVFLIILASQCAACSHTLSISATEQMALTRTFAHKTMQLRASMYYGDFYDENDHNLLSAGPPDQATMDPQSPTRAPQARGILAAGTRVELDAFLWPSAIRQALRLQGTPRNLVWIAVHVAADEARIPETKRPMVVVVPGWVETASALNAYLTTLFAPDNTLDGWLADLRPTIRVAIEHKEVLVGMTQEELMAAMGPPWRQFVDATSNTDAVSVYWTPWLEASLIRGVVVSMQKPRRR